MRLPVVTALCAALILPATTGFAQELFTLEFANGMRIEVARGQVRLGDLVLNLNERGSRETNLRRSEELVNLPVLSRDGEPVGQLRQLLINPQLGHVRYGIVSHQLPSEEAEHLHVVPWRFLNYQAAPQQPPAEQSVEARPAPAIQPVVFQQEQQQPAAQPPMPAGPHYVLQIDAETLEGSPRFAPDQWPDFTIPRWNRAIEQYYRALDEDDAAPHRRLRLRQ